jgi:hypothetical protein
MQQPADSALSLFKKAITMNLLLTPAPRSQHFQSTTQSFDSYSWVRFDPALPAWLIDHIKHTTTLLNRFCNQPLQLTAGLPASGNTLLTIQLYRGKLKAQGYKLNCSEQGITLQAADGPGALYGLYTLQQIIAQSPRNLPFFTITDYPDFATRGIMLDISRCKVPTIHSLKQLITLFSRLKINQLQLYTEHTFAFSAHHSVWAEASALTAADIIDLDLFCQTQGIELVANFNSFGHFERWLKHPAYHHLAECPNGFEHPLGGWREHGSTLKPNSATLRFLDSLYHELLPNFKSPLFNVGCDEPWELGCGYSKARVKKIGMHHLYLDFVQKIHALVSQHQKTMLFWGDIILHQPQLIPQLPKSCIALNWGYEHDHPFATECANFANAQLPFYVSPGTSSWNSLSGRLTNARLNMLSAAHNGLRHGATGFLNTDWGDGGHHQYLSLSYPAFVAGAAYSWCLATNKDVPLDKAVDWMVFNRTENGPGALLCELGDGYLQTPIQLPNKTIFNELLFWDGKRSLEFLTRLLPEHLDACQHYFSAISHKINSLTVHSAEQTLCAEEMHNCIAMVCLALERANLKTPHTPLIPVKLHSRLNAIINNHNHLWLQRNCPGGREESVQRLRSIAVS